MCRLLPMGADAEEAGASALNEVGMIWEIILFRKTDIFKYIEGKLWN